MIFKYCAECGHKLEKIRCGNDNACPFKGSVR
jgi:DNA-directed RNA polymerase subunit RPC12/RpoP